MSKWRLVSLEPWSAAGPGWANTGVTAIFEGPPEISADGRIETRHKNMTVYRRDMTAEEDLARHIGCTVYPVLERCARKALEKELSVDSI